MEIHQMTKQTVTRFAVSVVLATAMLALAETKGFAADGITLKVSAGIGVEQLRMTGPDARQQLVVTAVSPDGKQVDVTSLADYIVEPVGIVTVAPGGYVSPVANGRATIRITSMNAEPTVVPVEVSGFETQRPVSFPNDVIPQLTRAGCNSGACHGTPSGKNNFRLSLLGFEPKTDYEFLTRESRGRRVSVSTPEMSLFLRKAVGGVPHGGGARISRGSDAYQLLRRWVAEGLAYGPANDPIVERIEIFPHSRVVERNSQQQLQVTAFYSDGTTRDVTRVAQYKANQPDISEVDDRGLVTFKDRTGTTAVMIRFLEHVGAFMATVPLGMPTPDIPAPSNYIDEHVFAKLELLGLPPSEICDDVTFVRRAALDLTGRLPTIEQTQRFVASTDPDKRSQFVDELLDSPGYADLFANKWAGLLRNKAGGNLEQVARETYRFHAWIRQSLADNKPFDEFVGELLTARGQLGSNPPTSWYRAVSDPKDQMADIAQVFLGVRIQCAQCHHHPYEKWTQDDYYGFAAFFSTVKLKEVRKLPEDDVLFSERKLAIFKNPNTNEDLKPTPLDGEPLEIAPGDDPRAELSKWISDPRNPYFAKMLANRYWKHFFGHGLVDPEDDMRITNPSTNPELLNAMADAFVRSDFDLKQLCRDICTSRAYQLSSFPNGYNGDDEQNFARYYPRRMTAEVLLDAINEVAGARNNFSKQPIGIRAVALPDDTANRESFFLRVFGRPEMDAGCECERTADANLSQSLHLINSDTMQNILSAPNGKAVELARDAERSDKDKVTDLYLQAVSRPPSDSELTTALDHLKRKREEAAADSTSGTAESAARQAFEDIIWVIVNTKEFLFNH